MRKLFCFFCAGFLVAATPPVFGADEIYKIDPVHSTVEFKVRHLFGKVTGRFTAVSGTIKLDTAHPEKSSTSAVIDTKTIETSNAKRDTHLKSPDFFDVDKFPTMTFASKQVTVTGPDSGDIAGDLTIHGVTKEVVLHVKFLGKGKGMNGVPQSGWEARTSLNRKEFGLVWDKAIEGTQVVGDTVEVEMQIEADLAKE